MLHRQAPVAVCTLTDESLAKSIATSVGPEVAIVGTMQTENLGIERLIQNTLANPNIRSLIVCGLVSRLDHAAYLGKELARAEHSLRSGEPYKQDAAPETSASVWASACIPEKCNCH